MGPGEEGVGVLQPRVDLLESAADFPDDGLLLVITNGKCDPVRIRRDHAWLIPAGSRLAPAEFSRHERALFGSSCRITDGHPSAVGGALHSDRRSAPGFHAFPLALPASDAGD